MNEEFVYIARCPSHKHKDTNVPLIKIGLTRKVIDKRMTALSKKTCVPESFECLHLFKCPDCKFLESEIHEIFKDLRYTEDREFFAVSPECVVKVLEKYEGSFCDLNSTDEEKTTTIKKPGKRQTQITESKDDKILSLWRKDYTHLRISKELNVSINYVAKTIKSYIEEKSIATS
jgi:hypothetical protein